MSASAAMAVQVTLYEHAQFGDRRMTLRVAVEKFERTNSTIAPSIMIRSDISELCSDAYFRGNCPPCPGQYAGIGQE